MCLSYLNICILWQSLLWTVKITDCVRHFRAIRDALSHYQLLNFPYHVWRANRAFFFFEYFNILLERYGILGSVKYLMHKCKINSTDWSDFKQHYTSFSSGRNIKYRNWQIMADNTAESGKQQQVGLLLTHLIFFLQSLKLHFSRLVLSKQLAYIYIFGSR